MVSSFLADLTTFFFDYFWPKRRAIVTSSHHASTEWENYWERDWVTYVRLVGFYSRPPTSEYEIPFLKTDQSQLTSHILESWPLTFTIYARECKHKHGGYWSWICECMWEVTQFVNNTGIAHWFSLEIWAGSRYRFLKALMIGLLRDNGERNFILRRADVGGRE